MSGHYRIFADHHQWSVARVRRCSDKRTGRRRRALLTHHPTLAEARASLRERVLRKLWPKEGVRLEDVDGALAALSPSVSAVLDKATEGLASQPEGGPKPSSQAPNDLHQEHHP